MDLDWASVEKRRRRIVKLNCREKLNLLNLAGYLNEPLEKTKLQVKLEYDIFGEKNVTLPNPKNICSHFWPSLSYLRKSVWFI